MRQQGYTSHHWGPEIVNYFSARAPLLPYLQNPADFENYTASESLYFNSNYGFRKMVDEKNH